MIYAIHAPSTLSAGNLIFGTLVYGVCWVVGRVLRQLTLSQRALTEALDQLGREQQQRERLAVLDERTRLARDLHDVVAHAVALMVVQAGAARVVLDDDVDAARRGLLAVEGIGREATGDLRRMLGLLRAPDDDSLDPAPGLDGLDGLIERMSQAGLDVDMQMTGDRPELSASLAMSVFRIVQEALTNVLKHVGPTKVVVRLDYGDQLRVSVLDAGPECQRERGPSSGHGLLGMQERVAMFGGEFSAGRHDDGFAVEVVLPTSQAPG